jgi:signal transduction histidine kinase
VTLDQADGSELRTPLHQILAITQLLRSSMTDLAEDDSPSLTSNEQIRDMLPFLDAIDTSGRTLHGIVDNILSFLDLRAKDHALENTGLISTAVGAPQSLEVMFEEIVHEAAEEDKRTRKANGQSASLIETIFEIIPPLLGEAVTEDSGGALRR